MAETLTGRAVARLTSLKTLTTLGVIAAFLAAFALTRFVGLPIWSLFLLLGVVAYAAIVIDRPMVGLFVALCAFFLPIRFGGVTLLQSVGMFTALLIAIWFFRERRAIELGNLFIPLTVLGLMCILSLYYTRDTAETVFYIRKWVFNMAFYLMLTNLVTTFDALRRALWAIVMMACVNSGAAVYDFMTTSELKYRSPGLLENQNSLGILAALALPLALYQYLYRRGWRRWLSLGLVVVLGAGVAASVSRGALIALLVALALTAWVERRRWRRLLIVVLVAAVLVPLLPAYYFERVGNLVEDARGTVPLDGTERMTSRGFYNVAGLRIWSEHPILGVGVGNFGHYFVQARYNPGLQASTELAVHNIYLQALVEFGLVGAAMLAWLVIATTRNLWRAGRLVRHDEKLWVYFGGVSMMACVVFVASLSSGNLMGQNIWALISLAAMAGLVAEREHRRTAGAT